MPTKTKPRRQRFVVTYIKNGNRTTIDVLAFSKDSAVLTAHRNGIQPLSIVPFTKNARPSYRLNQGAIAIAKRQLGISWPVSIAYKGKERGTHKARIDAKGTPYHQICLNAFLTPEDAGRTLWHELRHAQQSEELSRSCGSMPGTPEYSRAHSLAYLGKRPGQRRGTNYRTRLWEIEARQTEKNNDGRPLAR